MAEAQRRATEDLEPSGRLAAGVPWQGVKTTALNMVEDFCRRSGLDPAQFISSQGWARSGRWEGNVDWRRMVNTEFDTYIRQNLRAGGVGLNLYTFTRGLESRAPTTETTAARQPAAEQRESAPPPRQEERPATPAPRQPVAEQQEAPAPRPAEQPARPAPRPRRQEAPPRTRQSPAEQTFTDALVRRGYNPEQAHQIMDIVQTLRSGRDVSLSAAQSLWQNDINEINDAWSSVSPSTRTVRALGSERTGEMFAGLLLRGPREGPRIAETTRPAPARTETYTYNVEYGVLDERQTRLTITTGQPISNLLTEDERRRGVSPYAEEFTARILRNPPPGVAIREITIETVGDVEFETPVEPTPARREALAADILSRQNDPLGTFALSEQSRGSGPS